MTAPPAARLPVYVGLMSGTSLDGITAVTVRFHEREEGYEPEMLAFIVLEYSAKQRDALHRAMSVGTAEEYCRLEFSLGGWLADAAVAVLAEAGVPRGEVRAVASHGQTLWHDPPRATWQIGEPAVIAERTGIDVVSDFRVRDVAAGGQGAPLVPLADALLFAGAAWRALQNVGGMGNVTIVPPHGGLDGVRAFDTGPGVAVIDGAVRALYRGARYDADGAFARQGAVLDDVVRLLLADAYFATEPPKSTGREWFGAAYVERLIGLCRQAKPDASPADVVATATALTARSIADAHARFMPEPVTEVLVSGGGARNGTLLEMLGRALAPRTVRRFSDVFFDDEAKEAVAFALLAHLFLERRAGNVPRATGAAGPRLLGKLTPA
ncbi:MAG: anhydro-N-acetylmuramic acid kinase [Gemmatimonadetes bacterium 21-71-4]|nr:MAG: anhydro-N-acetylmuramic acid kinase [Gemmatimonadetes bacterium 21-71-4]